jgi:hypothetical protein
MVLPRRGPVVVSHDGYRKTEEKGATPDPLMGVWPFGYRLERRRGEGHARLLSGPGRRLSGQSDAVGAVRGLGGAGRRPGAGPEAARRRLRQVRGGRFGQILEYRPDRFPEQPRAGPFFANMGGFLSGLLLGMPRLEPGEGEPETWSKAPVVLAGRLGRRSRSTGCGCAVGPCAWSPATANRRA